MSKYTTLLEVKNAIRDSLTQDIEEAFELMDKLIDTPRKRINKDLAMHKSNYNRAKQQMLTDQIGFTEANKIYSRVLSALLDLLELLKEEDVRLDKPKEEEEHTSDTPSSISDLERQGLENQLQILTEKMNFFKEEALLASSPEVKFGLKKRVQDMEAQITKIKQRLTANG